MPFSQRTRRTRESLLSRYATEMGECVPRHRAERALRAAAIEQALANKAKSEFLANMSHELRTPLNAIIGFSQLIAMTSGPEPASAKTCEYAGLIEQAGAHLLEIIADILDISKIESGRFELDLEPVCVADLAQACARLIEPRMQEKRQQLQIKIPAGLPAIVADQTRLKQVILNLLSNAHKFTPEGGRVTIAAGEAPQEGVMIAVQDTGIGMSGEQVALALTPFGQIRTNHTRAHEGTGLGLPIAKALIEQHGGRFLINSEENGGTTIAFILPTDVAAVPAPRPVKEYAT